MLRTARIFRRVFTDTHTLGKDRQLMLVGRTTTTTTTTITTTTTTTSTTTTSTTTTNTKEATDLLKGEFGIEKCAMNTVKKKEKETTVCLESHDQECIIKVEEKKKYNKYS